MREIDLALYADELAAESSALAARLERARGRVRRAALEREARRVLAGPTIVRLEASGILGGDDPEPHHAEIAALAERLGAVEELQAWVEEQLHAVTVGEHERGPIVMAD